MRSILLLVIGLVLALSGVTGLEFKETIKTNGIGTLYSKTNTDGAKDMTQGTGNIEYTRMVDSEDGKSILSSNYQMSDGKFNSYRDYRSFKKIGANKSGWEPFMPGYGPNRYMLAMTSPNKLSHMLSVYGTTDINSDSSIRYAEQKVTTNYNIAASGSLEESVLDGRTGKAINIADTSLLGNGFTINSGLTETAPLGSELAALLGLMNQTIMSGETGFEEPATKFKKITDAMVVSSEQKSDATLPKTDIVVGDVLNVMSISDSAAMNESNNAIDDTSTVPAIVVGETTPIAEQQPKIFANLVISSECDDPNTVCMNYTHLFAIRRPGIGQPQVPLTTGGGYVTFRRPVEALRGL